MKFNQKGFSVLELLIILLVVGLLGAVGWWVWSQHSTSQSTQSKANVNKTSANKVSLGNWIDAHAHLSFNGNDYSQTIGFMDKYNVSQTIVMQPPPNIDLGMTAAQFHIPEAAQKYPGRFKMMYDSDAISLLTLVARRGNYTQSEEDQFIKLVNDAANSGLYVGFGEIGLRHLPPPDTQGNSGFDITIPGDHPWLLALSDIAAQHHMVLDVHAEPQDAVVAGLEKLLAHNPKTKIVYAHAGWYDPRLATPQLFDRLLGKYPNLYATIKLRLPPITPPPGAQIILDQQGKTSQAWLDLIEKYPDRFMIGSDIQYGHQGEDGQADTILPYTNQLLDQLPKDVAQKVAITNAKRIYDL